MSPVLYCRDEKTGSMAGGNILLIQFVPGCGELRRLFLLNISCIICVIISPISLPELGGNLGVRVISQLSLWEGGTLTKNDIMSDG